MDTKDIILIILSSSAFCFSIASFILTFRQRSGEGKRATRKELTDVIAAMANVNLAFAKLELDYPGSTEEKIVRFRRTYNAQRRYLADHGEFLASQIEDLVTDIDYLGLAGAFEASSNFEKAEKFYVLAVSKSPNNVLRMINLRTEALFRFRQGSAAYGRELFDKAVKLSLPDTDSIRQSVADTYLMWARAEKSAGFQEESERIRGMAKGAARRIGSTKVQKIWLEQIDSVSREDKSGSKDAPA